jgi:hypothetical protein
MDQCTDGPTRNGETAQHGAEYDYQPDNDQHP